MSQRNLMLMAAVGSLAMLLGAFGFQYIGGMAPCKLCLWQRWPHAAAVLIGAIALIWPHRALAFAGAIAALTTAGLGLYHTGIERQWWQGPVTCTSGSVSGVSAEDLLNQILAAPVVRCDEVAWEMLTLSMASWNTIASVAFALIWFAAAQRSAR